MSFFEAFFRALAFLACCAVAVLIYVSMADAISTMELASISAETTQHLFAEQQETIRFLAQVNGETTRAAIAGQTSQVWAREAGDSVRTIALLACVAVVVCVLIWQAAKTLRHWQAEQSERNRQQAILLMFAERILPPDVSGRVRVEPVGNQLMLRDHSSHRQWTVGAAQHILSERGLLTDQYTR